ncbi:MAG TPA: alpha/beta hydrolase domain-containing protein, partial [Streptosporangiaceae bacterium]
MVNFSGPVTAGGIVSPLCVVPFDLSANGYVEEEFLVSGTASCYVVPGEQGPDGLWAAEASGSAAFRTRIVIRRPTDPARFSGTLLLEWLNVSSGLEADPDWAYLHEEIFRSGHAYAAVSAQALGVQGGESLIGLPGPPSRGLRGLDPVRYGDLEHPGDQYSFDLFGQIGAALGGKGRGGSAESGRVLGSLAPLQVLAIGESQSAFYLTSYINAVHP